MPRRKRKKCRLCERKVEYVDYKKVGLLKEFVNEKWKILPRRVTGNCAKHQRMVTTAIKRARIMGLLPFVPEL